MLEASPLPRARLKDGEAFLKVVFERPKADVEPKDSIVNTVKKPLSFIVDHNQIAPTKGGNARDPSATLAL